MEGGVFPGAFVVDRISGQRGCNLWIEVIFMDTKKQSISDKGQDLTKPGKKGFQPGVSGNPKGRPRGARNKITQLAEALLDGEAEKLVRKVIELALEGDMVALRLCFERILPPRKDRPISVKLSPIESPQDIADASAEVLRAVSEGTITPSEGHVFMTMLETHRKVVEVAELSSRLDRLEEHAGLDR